MKTLLLLFLLSGMAQANSLQQLNVYQSTAVYRVSGVIGVAASSTTYSTYTITLDGPSGTISASTATVAHLVVTGTSFNVGGSTVIYSGALYVPIHAKSELPTLSIMAAGGLIRCSDCTSHVHAQGLCISTGTANGSWAAISGYTTPCD